MLELLQTIVGYIETFFVYWGNTLEAIASTISMVASALAVPPYIVPLVPGVIGASILITIAVSVVRLIAGAIGGAV